MAKARKILSRLKAVRNVRTVTVAMETVATSRFKKTHNLAVEVRPYTTKLADLVDDVVRRCGRKHLHHPLLESENKARKTAMVVLVSNRGLCGGYNDHILSLAAKRIDQIAEAKCELSLHVVGKKGVGFLKFRNFRIDRQYVDFGWPPDFDEVAKLARELETTFLDGQIDAVEVAYMQFISSGRQSPAIARILPIGEIEPDENHPDDAPERAGYELLPSAEDILQRLLPAAVRLRLYQCFLDAAVSEQIARITAMRAANENANEMIHDLNLRYHRLRQSQITTELAEILGGRIGLK